MRPAAHRTIGIAVAFEVSDQHPNATVQLSGGRRSHMNEDPGFGKLAALYPATEGGKTISVTAEPGAVVPGAPWQSTPTTQPATAVPFGWPMSASGSLNRFAPP